MLLRVRATIGATLKRKDWDTFENIKPEASFELEKEVPDSLTEEEVIKEHERLYDQCRKLTELKISSDISSAKGKPVQKKEPSQ